ncbi:MAG: hypothetical protein DMG97_10840 [Acidobacteria bacterium]|nr:MAG: hypothetical protein DMG97_10840 [Acidobacteriota bacterium]
MSKAQKGRGTLDQFRPTYKLHSETPKNLARRFEVLHRRNHIEGVPLAPDFAMAVHLWDASRQN